MLFTSHWKRRLLFAVWIAVLSLGVNDGSRGYYYSITSIKGREVDSIYQLWFMMAMIFNTTSMFHVVLLTVQKQHALYSEWLLGTTSTFPWYIFEEGTNPVNLLAVTSNKRLMFYNSVSLRFGHFEWVTLMEFRFETSISLHFSSLPFHLLLFVLPVTMDLLCSFFLSPPPFISTFLSPSLCLSLSFSLEVSGFYPICRPCINCFGWLGNNPLPCISLTQLCVRLRVVRLC